ncbi:MAG TPA: hypothetical protein VMD79_14510 [Solirubrobacteraceae bacterium]|nr:hypothetical protein [Solirubrobacteraceae bacterium]
MRKRVPAKRGFPLRTGSARWCRLAAIALATAGCGGGAAVAAGPPLSRPVLVARAEAICRRRNAEIDAIKLQGTKPADIERFASQSTEVEGRALVELARLVPPSSMATAWRQMLIESRSLVKDVAVLADYAKRGDTRVVTTIAKAAKAAKRELLATGTQSGFTDCARVR